ncbi:Type I transmembrane sorting receptor [Ascosphaera pollenicola]|nr:Type I transmembrane sorting receptor [Ascosphaera pollenicola]
MFFQFQTLVSALTLSAAMTNAASIPRSKTSFSVQQIPVLRNATRALDHYSTALKKHGGRLPSSSTELAQASPSPTGEGTAKATPVGTDTAYVIPVTVGDTTMNLDLDTGSADLWVYASSTPESERGNHNIYQPSSNAVKLSDSSWDITYVDGSGASGTVYQDKVTIGDITYDKQGVEVATQVSQSFSSDSTKDGLIGMGLSSGNRATPKQKTFFDNVLDDLDEPLFTATLKHNQAGSYDFGFIDDSKYTGQIHYTDVDTSAGFWTISIDGYTAGDATGSGFSGVVDTGTTLLALDGDIVSAYYDQVSGAALNSLSQMYEFDCDTTLPDFELKIGDYTAKVSGDLINWGQDNGQCVGGLQSNGGGDNILGDIFLKSQFVVFENKNGSPRIGLAAQA